MTGSLALTQEFVGRYREANDSWKRAETEVAALGTKDVQAAFIVSSASGRAMAGRCEDGQQQVQAAFA